MILVSHVAHKQMHNVYADYDNNKIWKCALFFTNSLAFVNGIESKFNAGDYF